MMYCKTSCGMTRRSRSGARSKGRSSLRAECISNRNCRSDQDRHPERPTGVEGTLLRRSENSARGRSHRISNRNSRFTGFSLTPPESAVTHFLTATKPAISGFRGSAFRAPCCLRRNALESLHHCTRQFASGRNRIASKARR